MRRKSAWQARRIPLSGSKLASAASHPYELQRASHSGIADHGALGIPAALTLGRPQSAMMKNMELDSSSRLEEIFLQYAPDVLAYAARRGATREEAEDVLADTLVVCCRRLDRIPDAPLPWLLGVARRALANQLRARRRRLALFERMRTLGRPGNLDWESQAASVVGQDVRNALSRLSGDEREALFLVAWEGLTHEQAAEVLGMTRKGFSRRVSRARSKLMRHMAESRT